ncbi:Hydrophobic seed protein domain [Dillenia turbinata]|uniref:Hydrophobic seed protein domain n=1 Tax=Dillenia turbinata TaxID=194707 RepID=A0AAN8URW7_9MAGN
MAKQNLLHLLVFLLSFGTLLTSLACPSCPYPTPPAKPPKFPPKSPPKYPPFKPPYIPKPPYVPKPPTVKPPHIPTPPIAKPPPYVPPVIPTPPVVPVLPPPPPKVVPLPPPAVKPPPTPSETPCPPPPPPKVVPFPPPKQETCPIDTLKLDACVDLLGGLVHVGVGPSAKDTCCPVLQGLVDLDAALCLCTTIKAKLLNVKIILPIALEVLIACGKTPPAGFQCPA